MSEVEKNVEKKVATPTVETTEETDVTPESEEPQAYFEPVIKLDEVEVTTGEEEEEVIFKQRAKVFCYRETLLDKGTGKKSWCERGVGDVRFLKHKEHQKVRMLMRQEKTHKILINHLVEARTELTPNMGSDRAWVFSCYDFAEGVVETQVFALRFGNSENAQKFKDVHDAAKLNNKKLENGDDAADTSAGDDAAKALEALDVKKEE
ncbi:unnamed protein product [Peronospora farinosa]|uniref:RanBD1 domain-containing protein n=1 Tax=Peronospora farinosa TaxID=134698 RepID=A0AAV0TEN7_9STRA|nr:unnamed protein product [Peronospora farinosa]CAI5720760.1 unnamed protein product [Peronospora farinosa]